MLDVNMLFNDPCFQIDGNMNQSSPFEPHQAVQSVSRGAEMFSINRASSSEQATAPSGAPPYSNTLTSTRKTNQPSCNLCRRRKVKCNRTDPCSNCVRAGEVCVSFAPSGVPRGRQGGRRKHDRKLLDRVAKLESLVNDIERGTIGTTPAGSVAADGNWTV